MLHQLLPALSTKEKTAIAAAAKESSRMYALAGKFRKPHHNDGVLLEAHPLAVAVDDAFRAAAESPSEEGIVALLDAVNRRNALSENLAEHLAGAIGGHIAAQRETVAPIAQRLTDAALAAFEAEATARRESLPKPVEGSVIEDGTAAALEVSIANAKAALLEEIRRFNADPLASLVALAGD